MEPIRYEVDFPTVEISHIRSAGGGYDISLFPAGIHSPAWALTHTDALRKAQLIADAYKDIHGQPAEIQDKT